VRQVFGLGAVAGQAESHQSELARRKAKRTWPWAEWMGGSAEGCWAERLTLGRFRRVEGWVGLVGHAEWPARNRSEDRPLHLKALQLERWGGERVAVGLIRSADSCEAEKARGVGARERGPGRAGRGSRGCR